MRKRHLLHGVTMPGLLPINQIGLVPWDITLRLHVPYLEVAIRTIGQ
jgi:hypothetical protein